MIKTYLISIHEEHVETLKKSQNGELRITKAGQQEINRQIIEQQKTDISETIIALLNKEFQRSPGDMTTIFTTRMPLASDQFSKDTIFFCYGAKEGGPSVSPLGVLNGILNAIGIKRVAIKTDADAKSVNIIGFCPYVPVIEKEPATHVHVYSTQWNGYIDKTGKSFTRNKYEAALYLRREARDIVEDSSSHPYCKIMEPDDDVPAAR